MAPFSIKKLALLLIISLLFSLPARSPVADPASDSGTASTLVAAMPRDFRPEYSVDEQGTPQGFA
ncbi:MAG: hypothetical protein ABW095_11000, partial [Candidatus Thiodiazotropha sp.]